jgi:hypothetical protein
MNRKINTNTVPEVEGASGLQSEAQVIGIGIGGGAGLEMGGGAGIEMEHGGIGVGRMRQVARAETTRNEAQRLVIPEEPTMCQQESQVSW